MSQHMKIYGYSHKTKNDLLELYEATFSANPEMLRELADFLNKCAREIEEIGADWNHKHFLSSSEDQIKNGPEIVVFNLDAE